MFQQIGNSYPWVHAALARWTAPFRHRSPEIILRPPIREMLHARATDATNGSASRFLHGSAVGSLTRLSALDAKSMLRSTVSASLQRQLSAPSSRSPCVSD